LLKNNKKQSFDLVNQNSVLLFYKIMFYKMIISYPRLENTPKAISFFLGTSA